MHEAEQRVRTPPSPHRGPDLTLSSKTPRDTMETIPQTHKEHDKGQPTSTVHVSGQIPGFTYQYPEELGSGEVKESGNATVSTPIMTVNVVPLTPPSTAALYSPQVPSTAPQSPTSNILSTHNEELISQVVRLQEELKIVRYQRHEEGSSKEQQIQQNNTQIAQMNEQIKIAYAIITKNKETERQHQWNMSQAKLDLYQAREKLMKEKERNRGGMKYLEQMSVLKKERNELKDQLEKHRNDQQTEPLSSVVETLMKDIGKLEERLEQYKNIESERDDIKKENTRLNVLLVNLQEDIKAADTTYVDKIAEQVKICEEERDRAKSAWTKCSELRRQSQVTKEELTSMTAQCLVLSIEKEEFGRVKRQLESTIEEKMKQSAILQIKEAEIVELQKNMQEGDIEVKRLKEAIKKIQMKNAKLKPSSLMVKRTCRPIHPHPLSLVQALPRPLVANTKSIDSAEIQPTCAIERSDKNKTVSEDIPLRVSFVTKSRYDNLERELEECKQTIKNLQARLQNSNDHPASVQQKLLSSEPQQIAQTYGQRFTQAMAELRGFKRKYEECWAWTSEKRCTSKADSCGHSQSGDASGEMNTDAEERTGQ
ncbi:uncharacterized protein IL334_000261 [Kwoniella shivajii]|uniref:Uncharacterized protein n=1 Tax=Kwoniella shivajii TaxID=564305 RepID=A0ABZ1CNN4_9TREE|nr:hypothetical protein IL334_000261 [Kwoniella shivajii]